MALATSRADRVCTICGVHYRSGDYAGHRVQRYHMRCLRITWHDQSGKAIKRTLSYVQMKELYDQGYSYQAIGDAAGVSRQRVGQLLQEAGAARGRRVGRTCFVCGETYTQWKFHVDKAQHEADVATLIEQLKERT